MTKFLLALQFLTIVPIRVRSAVSERDVAGSAAYFPLVGLLEGIVLAAVSFGSLRLFSPAVTSVLIIAAYLAINGGFHQDGLSDTFDALSVKSTGDRAADRKKRLAVMRDSTSGPIGITAIAVFLLLKYTLLKEVLETPAHGLNPVIILFPMLSAWSMTMMMRGAKSARNEGLGKIFLGRINTAHVTFACIFLAASAAAVCVVSRGVCPFAVRSCAIFFIGTAILSLATGYLMRAVFTARFGGLTGDNLGCIHEIAEIMVLLVSVILMRRI